MNIIAIATLVGFFGDALTQLYLRFVPSVNLGLAGYFKKHGEIESMFIAAGVMAMLYIVYLDVLRLPLSWWSLALYGIIADLIFRWFRVLPSLDGFYSQLGYVQTAVFGAVIPMWLPFFIKSKLT